MTNLTITQALEKLRNKEISSVELTKYYLNRIKKLEPRLNAFVTVTEDEALKNKKRFERDLKGIFDFFRTYWGCRRYACFLCWRIFPGL